MRLVRAIALAGAALRSIVLILALQAVFAGPSLRSAAAQSRFGSHRIGIQMAFSNDAKTLAVAKGEMGLVELWDLETGTLRRTLAAHGNPVTALAFSPDDSTIATACQEAHPTKLDVKSKAPKTGVVRLWDAQTGEMRGILKTDDNLLSSITFSNDGQTLVTGGQAWYSGPDDLFIGPPSSRVVSRGPRTSSFLWRATHSYGEVKMWDLQTRKEERSLKWYGANLGLVSYSPDGRMLALKKTDFSSEIKLVDAETGKTIHTLKVKGDTMQEDIDCFAFSPDGHAIAVSVTAYKQRKRSAFAVAVDAYAHRIEIWSLQSGQRKSSFDMNRTSVKALCFSHDAATLLIWNGQKNLYFVSAKTGEMRPVEMQGDAPQRIAFAPGGRLVATGGDDNTVALCDPQTGVTVKSLVGSSTATAMIAADRFVVSVEGVLTLAFSPDGETLASAGEGDTIDIWDAPAGVNRRKLRAHSGSVLSVAISPNGETLASAGTDGVIRFWNLKDGLPKRTLAGYRGRINSIIFSRDGRMLASAGDEGKIRLWDVSSGAVRSELGESELSVESLAFSPDGRLLASGDEEAIRLWDTKSGMLARVLQGHSGPVRSVAFSPDGTTLASASADSTVRLWNVPSGDQRLVLTKHDGPVNSVAFAPSGRFLASGSDDRTVNIWVVATGKLHRSLKGQDIAVYSVCFSPNGRVLASGSGSNGLIFWDPETGDLKQIVSRPTVLLRDK